MKMHTLSCTDLGTRDCDFVAKGGTDAEVKRKMLDHASEAHPEAVKTPAQKDALGRRIDKVLAEKSFDDEDSHLDAIEGRGAHGRYGMEEDESQGGEFLDDESARGGRAAEREAVQHTRGTERGGAGYDESEPRRSADRDAEEKRTGADLR